MAAPQILVNEYRGDTLECFHYGSIAICDEKGLVRSVGDILRKNGFGPRLLLAADEQTLAAAEGKPLVQYTYHGAALACHHIAGRLCGRRVPLMKITNR